MEKKPQIVKELTPELANKIYKSIQKKMYDDKVSKEAVLHYLKQLKAQIGKIKKKYELNTAGKWAVSDCMDAIDKKIDKINSKPTNHPHIK